MIRKYAYKELKTNKTNRNFGELIGDFLDSSNAKKGSGLRSCLGILKKDKEWEKIEKTNKKG
nr:hypothetical protein [Candidatus Woesearchaeota archaeon]